MASQNGQAKPQIQPCRYKTGKTLGAGSYSVVKECVHIDTGRYYAAKVINKRMMAGREHMSPILPSAANSSTEYVEKAVTTNQTPQTSSARPSPPLPTYTITVSFTEISNLRTSSSELQKTTPTSSSPTSASQESWTRKLSTSSQPHAARRATWPRKSSKRRVMANQCKQIPILPTSFISIANDIQSDVWAIGVITYFLLCGYTPFDRDSNLEEMQAILIADYSFTPLEYWRGVSLPARDFIKRCLTIDPQQRMTSHQALSHAFVKEPPGANSPMDEAMEGNPDLLPTIKKNFNARRTLHAAIDTIRAINKLREGGAQGLMDGAFSGNPMKDRAGKTDGNGGDGGWGGADGAGDGGWNQGGGGACADGRGDNGGPMEIDSRGNARGQTEEMIREQERRVQQTARGLWGGR
ncbi:MAG: hypothetical protein Q9174_003702 [Haloplaca sp. 1 TL-2023]